MPLPLGRPNISDETPGPALAVLAICSAGASAFVAGSTIVYQIKHKQLARESDYSIEWNVLLSLALVRDRTASTHSDYSPRAGCLNRAIYNNGCSGPIRPRVFNRHIDFGRDNQFYQGIASPIYISDVFSQ